MKILRLLMVITALFWALMPSGVAFADQANPDNTPSMTANVYRNLLVTGDQLYLFYANIPYTTEPDEDVTDAFIWRLYDTDNATVLGQTVGSVYQKGGYGYNVYSMYFSVADAPTWNQSYIVRLSGNPSVFDTPPIYDFILNSSDFSALTVTTQVQDELATRILAIATDLNYKWGLTATESLIYEQETGTALSWYGEQVFRSAIYGVQALAPAAFQFSSGVITAVDREWETAYVEEIATQYTGTFVETAQDAGADLFNKSYDFTSVIFLLALLVGIFAGNILITQSAWSGMIDVALVAVVFGRIGIPAVLLPFIGLVAALSWIYISAKAWGVIK